MNKVQFDNFLESLKTPENKEMLESINKGFLACFEGKALYRKETKRNTDSTSIGQKRRAKTARERATRQETTKQEQNSKTIDSLTAENGFLEGKTQEAATFRDNLKAMLGHASKEIIPENKS